MRLCSSLFSWDSKINAESELRKMVQAVLSVVTAPHSSCKSSSLTWFVRAGDPALLVSNLLSSREGERYMPHEASLCICGGSACSAHIQLPSSISHLLSLCASTIAVTLFTGQDQAGNRSVLPGFSTASSCLPNAPQDKQPPTAPRATGLWGQHLALP